MKKSYEKPVIEVITFEYDVLTASAGGGTTDVDIGDEWYPDK